MVQKSQIMNFFQTDDKLKREYFDIASVDSMTWLENAELLKLSADLLYENVLLTYEKRKVAQHTQNNFIIGTINHKRKEIDELEDKLKSFNNTYYLLIGYAFENVIKGLSIKNNPGLSFKEIYDKHWKKYKFGHGFSDIDKPFISNLSSNETKLLERLEKYVIWIGKYPIAKDQNCHSADYDEKYFDSGDKSEIDDLFAKIRNLLIEKNRS